MQDLETRATKRYNERRRSTARRYGIGLLALLVLLCTAAALLLPAFTLEKDVFCGLEEHTHTEDCYQMVPVCGVEEHAAHTHTDACFETVRELSCGLEESEGHTHSDACFKEEKALTCVLEEDEGHTHSDACFKEEKALTCVLEEDEGHTHTDACYIEEREPVCGIVEDAGHIHDESCWVTERELVCALEENEEHQHDDACYIENPLLVCGEEEREGHVHDDSCYETYRVPNCGEEAREGHTHTDECYTVKQKLVCELPEDEGHTHTDACYTDTQKLICTLPEDEGHTHSEACMEEKLVCEKEEHTHSLQCYSNPEAVESEAEWLLSFPAFTEDTPRLERLLGIAASQIGYQESAANYRVDENESLHGYTRFGDFCGEPYADWNAMFVSFCLHYAEIDPAIFPAEGDGQSMIDALTEKELYIPNGTEGFMPRPGDLIFFDNIYTGTYDVRVGIVTSVDRERGVLTVMEGDSADSVAECRYAPDDTTILGYGVMPEELRAEADAAAETETETTETETTDADTTGTGTADTKDADTKDTDSEEPRVRSMLKGKTNTPLLGASDGEKSEKALTDLASVTPTKVYFDNLNRGAEIELAFYYEMFADKVSEAKASSPWVYDLTDYVGVDRDFLSFVQVTEKADIKSGGETVGKYTIIGGVLSIYPDDSYVQNKDHLSGTFNIKATLNEEEALDSNEQTIEFPGGGKITIEYRKKEMDHNKSVNGTQTGDVQVTQDADGNYILNYTINVKPKDSLKRLLIEDTLSGEQTLDADSIKIDGVTPANDSLSSSGNGFTLDLPKHLGTNAQGWKNYTITYQTKVSEADLGKTMGNTASYKWDGENDTDNTNVTPHFEEHLETSKTVGGSESSIYATSGNVDVKEDGEYYLYYRVTARPNARATELTIEDTIGPGQTLDGNISMSIDGSTPTPISASTTATPEGGTTFTYTITRDATNPILPGQTVVLTYKVKLTKNADSDASVLSGVKNNDSKWTWNTKNYPDHTTVTPHEPPPTFPVTKKASVITADPSDPNNNTVTYTITVGDGEVDLSGYTFNDIIANYPFDINSIVLKETGKEDIPITRNDIPAGTATGATYTLFSYTFPKDGNVHKGPYTFTYTITLKNDTGLAGRHALTNTGEIGSGSSTTTTTVDYGEPGVEKHWSAWDKTDNSVVWTVIVTVPEGKSFTNLSVTEQDFKGGGEWYQGDEMTVDWSSLKVYKVGTEGKPGDEVPAADYSVEGNTVTFTNPLSESRILTLKTKLKEGMTFANIGDLSDNYYVTNGVKLKVGDDDITTVIDKKKYEKAEYDFTKTGDFNDVDGTGRPVATWTVVINPEGHSFEEDMIPYFVDTIPEGMEFYGDKINIRVDGHGNTNRYGTKIYQPSKDINYTTSDREIGRIDLVNDFIGDWNREDMPSGLSGMTYYVTYQTRMTAEKWAEVQTQIGTYTFTNKAKIVDKDGKTVKTTGDTITYEYKEMVKKVDLTPEDTTAQEIKYRIQINPNYVKLNEGKTLELYDVLSTDVTLNTTSIRVYEGVASADTEAMPETSLKYSGAVGASNTDTAYSASYDDNTRKLQVFVPDETACVVEFSVIPSEDSGTYQNTAVLRAGSMSFNSTVTKNHKVTTSVTLEGDTSAVRIKKLDLYELNKPLLGAKFKLYRAELASDGTIQAAYPIQSSDSTTDGCFVSDTNGIVNFNNVVDETEKIQEGNLYYWVETEAPTGHMLTDPSPHYFVIYRAYTTTKLHEQKSQIKKTDLRDDTLWGRIVDELSLEEEYFASSNLSGHAQLLQDVTNRLNDLSLADAKALDNKAQDANNIIVATILNDYTWNWRNAPNTAYAVLKGMKTLYGRDLEKADFAFMLQDMSDPDKPLRVQIVRNGDNNGTPEGGALDQVKGFTFSELSFKSPGIYRYRITEYKGARPFSDVAYDTAVYDVEIRVEPEDLTKGRYQIPENRITYRKNGEKVDSAQFFNTVDKASVTVTKTFSGDYPLSDGFKNQVTFTVREKPVPPATEGRLVKTFTYGQMTAGTYTLTEADGIEADKEYIVTESNADITGTVRTTTYTIKGVKSMETPERPATVSTEGDKAAKVDFDNSYKPKSMNLYIAKKWHLEKDTRENADGTGAYTGKNMQALTEVPSYVREAYFKLQRYTGPEPAQVGAEYNENNWVFVNSNTYEAENITPVIDDTLFQNRRYDFDNWITVKYEMGWTKELEDLPIGRYRLIEIERDTTGGAVHWKPVNHGNVVYPDETLAAALQDGQIHPIPHWQDTMTTPEKGVDNIYFSYDVGTNENGDTLYASNRLYEIDFTKQWFDKDGNKITADNPYEQLGVQSVTLQLQAATLDPAYVNEPAEDQIGHFSAWTNVAGQTKTIPDDADNGKVTFTGIPRKDAAGNSLYYRVVETRMVLSDGTILNADQIAERFELTHEPTNKKPVTGVDTSGGNAYMHPADGADYGHQTVDNTEKPHGISVTKAWNITGETPQDVYVQLRAKVSGGFTEINDANIKTDAGQAPIVTTDNKCLYRIRYNTETRKYEPITFSYLFRKNDDHTVADKPTYNWADVEAIQFIEYSYNDSDNSCALYNDGTHQVTYAFNEPGKSETAYAGDGISPLAIGTYTVGNNKREPAVIKVTKNWVERQDTDNTIYFKLYLVGENGTSQELYVYSTYNANDPNATGTSQQPIGVTNEAKNYNPANNWVSQYSGSVAKLNYSSDKWDELIFNIPAELLINNTAGNYFYGVYVVETDESGKALADSDTLHISYSFVKGDSTETYSNIGPGKPTPAGNGTLTIQNAPPGTRPSVKKTWKSGDTDAEWPDAVKNVGVQLMRKVGEAEPVNVGDVIYLTAANSAYTWPAQEEIAGAIYYAKEVSVTWMENGSEKTITGSALKDWFSGTSALSGSYAVEIPAEDGTGKLGIGTLTNKIPTEEKTWLRVSKAWVDEDVTLLPPEGGETITLRLMSKTKSETAGTVVNLTGLRLDKLDQVTGSDTNLLLTADADEWPIGQILDLPRYRNGENIYYYVEELSATDKDGKAAYYQASYSLNFSTDLKPDPQAVQTTGGKDELIYIVNVKRSKKLDVEKKWAGAFLDNHSEETVKVYLYSWTDAENPPVIDTSGGSGSNDNITNLKLVTEGLDAGDWWYISFWNVSKNGGYVGMDYQTINQDSTMPFVFPPMPYKDSDDPSAAANRYSFDFQCGAEGSKYEGCQVYLTGDGITNDTIIGSSVWKGTVTHDASPGELTLHFKFIKKPTGNSLTISDMTFFDAGSTTAPIVVYNLDPENLPTGATLVDRSANGNDNPIVLNSGTTGWSYSWDDLPEEDAEHHKLYYAAVETEIGNTIALSNKVSYLYTYDDGSTSTDTITPNKNVVKVEVTNEASYPVATEASLKIVKVDANGMTKRLTGAEFQLWRKANGASSNEYVTVGEAQPVDADGSLTLKGLGAYDYKLVETKAPPGYVISGDPFEFSFSDRGTLSSTPSKTIEYKGGGVFNIGNAPGVELPATGGVGVGAYRIGGAALLLAATGLAAAEPLKRSRADRARRRKGGEGET